MLALKLALHHVHYFAIYRPPATAVDNIANVALAIGCALFILFTLVYGFRFRWYRTLDDKVNWAGIAIFSVFFAISALLVYSVATRLLTTGDYPLRDLFRLFVYLLLPASGTLMFVGLLVSREQMLRELRAASRHNTRGPEAPVDSREA